MNLIKKDIIIELQKRYFNSYNRCISRTYIVVFSYFFSKQIINYQEIFTQNTSSFRYNDYYYEKEIERFFVNKSLDFELIYEINMLIDELIQDKLLIVSLYPPKVSNNGINYLVTIGLYNQYFEMDKEEDIYNYRMNLKTYVQDYFRRKRLCLLENNKLLEKIEKQDRFREYYISRSRWSDLEGMSNLEIQFFHFYIVLIEFFTYGYGRFYVAVVQKNIYESNPKYEKYLPYVPRGDMEYQIGHDNTEFSKKLAKKIYNYYLYEGEFIFGCNNDKAICIPEKLIEIHEQAHLELNDNLFSD